jgi:hypothetical protein
VGDEVVGVELEEPVGMDLEGLQYFHLFFYGYSAVSLQGLPLGVVEVVGD